MHRKLTQCILTFFAVKQNKSYTIGKCTQKKENIIQNENIKNLSIPFEILVNNSFIHMVDGDIIDVLVATASNTNNDHS
jgi:hypothetical protein